MKGLNRKGLTLVELLIYVALVSVITTILVIIFMVGFKDFVSGSRFVDQQTRLNNAYLSFREQYEKAREVIITKNNNGDSQVELKYAPVVNNQNSMENQAVFIENAKSTDASGNIIEMQGILLERAFHKIWTLSDKNEFKLLQKDATTNTESTILNRLESANIQYLESENMLTITLTLKPDNVTQQNQQEIATGRNITRPVVWSFDTIHKKVTVNP